MSVPSNSDVSSLEFVDWSLPLVTLDLSSSVNSETLDYVDWSLPLVLTPNSAAPPAPTSNVYAKVSGVWKQASKLYINVSGVWKESADDLIYYNDGGTWKS